MALVSINWSPQDKQLRSFGGFALLAFGLLGASVWFRQQLFGFSFSPATAQTVGGALFVVAGVCGALALGYPRALKPLFLGLSVLTAPIGFVVSHVLLALIFYLVFTPIGLVMKLIRFDPLQRTLDKSRDSYWEKRAPASEPARYFRQY